MNGYIGVTTRSWFDFLKTNRKTDVVNFWRKNNRDFKVLKKGEYFFFLVKNPKNPSTRYIEGYGVFDRYDVLNIKDAWDMYQYGNGCSSRDELEENFRILYKDSFLDIKIGCIILKDIVFFDNLIDLELVGVEFQKNIVSGKAISEEEIAKIITNNDFELSFDDLGFTEGKTVLKTHLSKERNRTLIKVAKEEFIKNHGKLYCEVCGFDFEEVYGDLGKDYIECHHLLPVSQISDDHQTKISDLAMVCSNCHSMIHRKRPWLNRDNIRKLVNNYK